MLNAYDLLNAYDKRGYTLLHRAVFFKRLNMVKMLIGLGAKLDICDKKHGMTPISLSKEGSQIEKLLLKEGSPISLCQEIHLAAKAGNVKRIKEILSQNPKKIEALDSKWNTPLFYAAKYGKKEAAKYLIDNGANTDVTNASQKNVIDYAKNKVKTYLKKRISLTHNEREKLVSTFKNILKKEYQKAKKLNKNIIVMLGETHGNYNILELKKRLLQVAKKIGITQLNMERPWWASSGKLELYAQKHDVAVKRVDNHPFRKKASIQERNIVIAKEINNDNRNCVLVVGSSHMQGLLAKRSGKVDPMKYHILPFNLGRIIKNYSKNVKGVDGAKFFSSNKKIIQVSKNGISDHKLVIKKWNNDNAATPNTFKDQSIKALTLGVMCLPIYTIALHHSLLATGMGCLVSFAAVNAYNFYKDKMKTYGLAKYRKDYAKKNISAAPREKLQSFLNGAESTIHNGAKNFLTYYNWRHMQDYYAGKTAQETEEHKLIYKVKKCLRKSST